MAALSIHPESVYARFWRDEGHALHVPAYVAKWGLALLILNEIRGLVVAGSVAWQMWA